MKKTTSEGLVLVDFNEKKTFYSIIQINCETDFVSNNFEFKNFGKEILKKAITYKIKKIDDLLTCDNNYVTNLIKDNINKFRENIIIKNYDCLEKENNEGIGYYIHNFTNEKYGKTGSLLLLKNKNETLSKDMAMQISSMNPKILKINKTDSYYNDDEILYEQKFIKNNKQTVYDILKESKNEIISFTRYSIKN